MEGIISQNGLKIVCLPDRNRVKKATQHRMAFPPDNDAAQSVKSLVIMADKGRKD
jgi:hypothetical protein